MKEIKVKPLDEDNKNGKMLAYIFLFQPILCIFAAIFIIFINIKTYEESLIFLIALGIFILLALYSFFINIQYIANGVLAEEICYIENKTFYYQKFRRVFGMRKLIKKLEIPLSEILEVKEGKKPFFLYFFLSPVSHRNSAEIITRDGKKYKIMNSVVFGNRSSLNPTSSETNARTKEIFSKVKEMIFKTKNTLNF